MPYTVKNPKSQWRSGVFIILYLTPYSCVSIVNSEHEIAGWERFCQFYFFVACYLDVTESFLKIVLLCIVVNLLLVLQDNNAQQL